MKIENKSKFHLAVQAFIQKEKLLKPEESVICAISGGVDSMVLGTILQDLEYPVIVAHFNYKLRGSESDEDEAFVKKWAEEQQLPFHLGTLPEPNFWQNEGRGKNIQLEARRLRYEWLNELKIITGIAQIATGHHADDQEETILMNFFRGTGISGLRGILPASNGIIRPLLSCRKKDIITYARQHVGHWRNDSSNETDKYRRNEIRHHLLPVLESVFPGFQPVILRNSDRFRIIESEVKGRYKQLHDEFFLAEKSGIKEFDFSAIQIHESGRFFLTELILKLGLDFDLMNDWWNLSLSNESRIWKKGNIEVEIKNNRLIINTIREYTKPVKLTISGPGTFQIDGIDPICLFVYREKKSGEFIPENSSNACYLDSAKISFPLILESWKTSDRIKPLGMKGNSKLVSDLLTEKGLSQLEKNRIQVLKNLNGEILWIPGIRSSELGKITSTTDEIIVIVRRPG